MHNEGTGTYAGQPMTIATIARIVSPLPKPRAEYIAGANRGNPKPANDRRNETAANADSETPKQTVVRNVMIHADGNRTHQKQREA